MDAAAGSVLEPVARSVADPDANRSSQVDFSRRGAIMRWLTEYARASSLSEVVP